MLSVLLYLFLGVLVIVPCVVTSNHRTREEIRNFIRLEQQLIKNTNSVTAHNIKCYGLLIRHQHRLSLMTQDRADRSQYVQNHLNLFSLVHRMTSDWPVILSLMKTGQNVGRPNLPIQVQGLWVSGVIGFIRLQEIYSLDTETLVRGEIEGTLPHAKIAGSDCFGIGVHYFRLQHYVRAVEWFLAALQKAYDPDVSMYRVLQYLRLAYCFIGDRTKALVTLSILLKEYPNASRYQGLLGNYTNAISRPCSVIGKDLRKNTEKSQYSVHFTRYYEHCQMINRPTVLDKDLRCRLIHYNHSHLRISPFKMEEVHLDPPVLLFHDVIYDKEIIPLQTAFHNRMKHAMLDYYENLDTRQDTQYNIWIESADPGNEIAGRISRRTAQMTNMRLEFAEPCMMSSYGVGGEIKLHGDLGEHEFVVRPYRTRADYVTFMYYLNDVPEGGITILPAINKSVVPQKGSAVMWFNRYPDWSMNKNMLHSGCPVLRGSKWMIQERRIISWWCLRISLNHPSTKIMNITSNGINMPLPI